jgi:hypothetical protein
LPDDWQERLVEFLHPREDQAEVEEQEQALHERLLRARELYLAGDIDRGGYLEEKWAAQVALISLHPLPKDVILAAGLYLSDFDHLWSQAHSYPEKARLLRVAVAAAFVKGRSLVALQPTESFFPLMHYCWSGSDGRDSLGPVPEDGIETLPPGLPLPDPDRTGIEQGPAAQLV